MKWYATKKKRSDNLSRLNVSSDKWTMADKLANVWCHLKQLIVIA